MTERHFKGLTTEESKKLQEKFRKNELVAEKNDKVMWAVSLGTIIGVLVILYTPLGDFLKLAPLSLNQFIIAVSIAVASVIWYEVIKVVKYMKKQNKNGFKTLQELCKIK